MVTSRRHGSVSSASLGSHLGLLLPHQASGRSEQPSAHTVLPICTLCLLTGPGASGYRPPWPLFSGWATTTGSVLHLHLGLDPFLCISSSVVPLASVGHVMKGRWRTHCFWFLVSMASILVRVLILRSLCLSLWGPNGLVVVFFMPRS